MKRVLKFPIEIQDKQTVQVPADAKFISVIEQNNAPALYAIADTDKENVDVVVLLRGTGHPIMGADGYDCEFLGTIETHEKSLVWHIFVEHDKVY